MRHLLAAGLLAAVAAPVLAQSAAPEAPRAPIAAKVMTRADVDARIRSHFARVDSNRDGFVTTQEMSGQRAQRMASREARKGQRPGRAATRDPNAAFDRMDANRDGVISRAEFSAGRELRVAKRDGRPGANRMRLHRKGAGMMGAHLLRMADGDRDGRVSLGEATAGAMRHFDMLDTNRDGRVTAEERRAGRMQMRQVRQRQAS